MEWTEKFKKVAPCPVCGTSLIEVQKDRYICPNYPKHPPAPDLPPLKQETDMYKCPACHKESKDPLTVYFQPKKDRFISLNGNNLGITGPAVRVHCTQCGNEELALFDPDVASMFRKEYGIEDNQRIDKPRNIIQFTCPKCKEQFDLPNYPTRFKCACGFECDLTPLDQSSPTKTFSSGAWRDDANTPAYSLIPPCAIRRLANVYKEGEQHYPDRNWRKGIPVTNIIDHALEHLMKWLSSQRNEDHLAKVAWAMFSLMYYEDEKKLEDDVKWVE